MAKPLADCRLRIEFPSKKEVHNIGIFYNPISGRVMMKIGRSTEEVTASELGRRIGKWIGDGVKK
jgi:hypothetical protein